MVRKASMRAYSTSVLPFRQKAYIFLSSAQIFLFSTLIHLISAACAYSLDYQRRGYSLGITEAHGCLKLLQFPSQFREAEKQFSLPEWSGSSINPWSWYCKVLIKGLKFQIARCKHLGCHVNLAALRSRGRCYPISHCSFFPKPSGDHRLPQ